MTPIRAGVSLLLIAAVGLTVVALQAARVQQEARAEADLAKLVELRRAAWNADIELARLSAPEKVRERVESMQLSVGAAFGDLLGPPAPKPPTTKPKR
jgi:hypothetical protein